MGFGSFNLSKMLHRNLCPLCKEKTQKVENFGYFKANIELEGVDDETEKVYDFKDYSNSYIDFKDRLDGQIRWSYLDAKVTPI